MPFQNQDRELLLNVKGVGPKVVERLEQMGFSSLEDLAGANSKEITEWISEELGSTCWRNSPQARVAIEAAISAAKFHSVPQCGDANITPSPVKLPISP